MVHTVFGVGPADHEAEQVLDLGIGQAHPSARVLPERAELAAVYRRAALVLLPSEREGFGLPLAEAMACGTPVIASAIPSLLEVGGSAVTYCAPEDLNAWVTAVLQFLRQRDEDPDRWEVRRQQSVQSAARFDWRTYAAEMTRMYQAVCTS